MMTDWYIVHIDGMDSWTRGCTVHVRLSCNLHDNAKPGLVSDGCLYLLGTFVMSLAV